RGSAVSHGSGDVQDLFIRSRRAHGVARRESLRRQRLREGLPGREAVPRREDRPDLRGDVEPAAADDRQEPARVNLARGSTFIAVLIAAWAIFAMAVYLPDVGRGFVKDDFGWVETGRAALDAPSDVLFPQTPGFYRPAVALTFAADYLLHDSRPRGYGFTNLALYVLCIGAIAAMGRAIGLSAAASTLAAFVWSVNPHGLNMALVWISGRTSLCLALFAVLAAAAFIRRRYGWTAIWMTCALASKEEAVALPVILLAWDRLLARRGAESPRSGANWRAIAS